MKYAAIVALALAASPAVAVQPAPACEDVRTLTDLALEGFRSIKLEPTYETRTYNAALVLPRADRCVVWEASVATYECAWTFDSLRSLTAAQEELLSALRTCLSGWEVVPEGKKVEALADTEFTNFGTTLRGEGRHASVSVKSWAIETLRQGIRMCVLRFMVTTT